MSYDIAGPEGETFEDYVKRVYANDYFKSGEWRLGQTFYNCAPSHVRYAAMLSKKDPYYQDEMIAQFLVRAKAVWDKDTVHLFYVGDFSSLCGAGSVLDGENHTISETTCVLCITEYNAMILEDMEKQV